MASLGILEIWEGPEERGTLRICCCDPGWRCGVIDTKGLPNLETTHAGVEGHDLPFISFKLLIHLPLLFSLFLFPPCSRRPKSLSQELRLTSTLLHRTKKVAMRTFLPLLKLSSGLSIGIIELGSKLLGSWLFDFESWFGLIASETTWCKDD